MTRDHYDVLQVKRDASAEDIQRAYRVLALRYHPDRNPAADAAARMAVINEAYEVLGDPVCRRNYDAHTTESTRTGQLAASFLLAARDVILRSRWAVIHDESESVLLEQGKQQVRVVFTSSLNNDVLRRISRQYAEFTAILAVSIQGPLSVNSRTVVIDIVRSEHHGGSIPDGVCKSLLSGFL